VYRQWITSRREQKRLSKRRAAAQHRPILQAVIKTQHFCGVIKQPFHIVLHEVVWIVRLLRLTCAFWHTFMAEAYEACRMTLGQKFCNECVCLIPVLCTKVLTQLRVDHESYFSCPLHTFRYAQDQPAYSHRSPGLLCAQSAQRLEGSS
jgi:hypothetical protein